MQPHPAENGGSAEREENDGRGRAAPPGRGDRINVGAPDDQVTRTQLAARWAEAYAPQEGEDTLEAALHRFRRAYEYLDAVTHGVEPPALEEEKDHAEPARQERVDAPAPSVSYAPPSQPAPEAPVPPWQQPQPAPPPREPGPPSDWAPPA